MPGASLRFVSHWPVLETACFKFQWRFTCLSPPPGCPDLRRGRRPAPPACLSAGLVASQGKHEVPGVLRREGNGYVGVEIRSHRLELEVRRRQRLCGPPPGRCRVWTPPRGANGEPRRRPPVGPASRWVWLDHRCLKDSKTRSATDPATGHPEILWEWREVERHRTRAPRAWSQGKRTARPSSQAGLTTAVPAWFAPQRHGGCRHLSPHGISHLLQASPAAASPLGPSG